MTRPPDLYIHRAEGTYHFHEEGPDHGYEFVSLTRSTPDKLDSQRATPFKQLRPAEQDAGWKAFDEWRGHFRETRHGT